MERGRGLFSFGVQPSSLPVFLMRKAENSMVKAILFDFDGTLSDRYAAAYEMYRWYLKEMMPEEDVNSLSFEAKVQQCLIYDEYGTIDRSHVLEQIKKKWVKDLDVEKWRDIWYSNFFRYQRLMEHCEETLDQLKEKYKLAIITNGPEVSQMAKVKALGMDVFFPVVVVGGAFGKQKPDVSIYQYTAQQLGVKPEECVFIGDTFSTDIYGALRAGMQAVMMCHDRRFVSNINIPVVNDWMEIKTMFLHEEN